MDKKLREVSDRHERKYTSLLKEHNILIGLTQNSNEIITNLTGDTTINEHELIFGLKHGLATRPMWDQLERQNLLPKGYMKQQRIKHSIRTLACNFLDFDDKRPNDDHNCKRIKILKELNEKCVILKPDKDNGVVLLKRV